MVSLKQTIVSGYGHYLPENIVTNAELTKTVDTTDEWIQKRTGIKQRHIAGPDELTSDMAYAAAKNALDKSGLTIDQIDGIILATTSPDRTFPATAVRVQALLDMKHGFAFDIQAVCSGFVYSMRLADNMIKMGQARNIIIIGAEKFSNLLDWNDRTTCVLFGDGAGAFVLSASDVAERGILSTHIHSDGHQHDLLMTDGGPALNKTTGVMTMDGREVFKHAVTNLAAVVEEVLEHNNIQAGDLDWLVPHQANARIIETTAKKLNMPMERVILTVAEHGNTSAASVPLAFSVGASDGRLKKGDLILLEAMGAGLTWGAVLLRY